MLQVIITGILINFCLCFTKYTSVYSRILFITLQTLYTISIDESRYTNAVLYLLKFVKSSVCCLLKKS